MEIELLGVSHFRPAIMSTRAAMKSYHNSDSTEKEFGPADRKLFENLIRQGPQHCKGIRQIYAWLDVTAPRFWWQEMDTYRIGVEKGSESTMHKLASRHVIEQDFDDNGKDLFGYTIDSLNTLIDQYQKDRNPETFLALKRNLPESFLQKRFVCASYQALRTIYWQRYNHRLPHWKEFCEWLKSLPEAWIICMDIEKNK
jgi:hypothetical protein